MGATHYQDNKCNTSTYHVVQHLQHERVSGAAEHGPVQKIPATEVVSEALAVAVRPELVVAEAVGRLIAGVLIRVSFRGQNQRIQWFDQLVDRI